MRTPDELREAIEAYLVEIEHAAELGRLEEVIRYALDPGGPLFTPPLDDHILDSITRRRLLGLVAVQERVTPLDDGARREEIARMLAGATVTEEARAAAGRLLDVRRAG